MSQIDASFGPRSINQPIDRLRYLNPPDLQREWIRLRRPANPTRRSAAHACQQPSRVAVTATLLYEPAPTDATVEPPLYA